MNFTVFSEGQNRVAVVTGGSSGIGKALAVELSLQNYYTVIVGSSQARVDETIRTIKTLSGHQRLRHIGLRLDVSSEVDMREMIDTTLREFGRIDLLIASAGIGRSPESDRVLPYAFHKLPLNEWNTILNVNLTGIFLSNRAVIPTMKKQGEGHIINICSSTTPRGLRGTAYAPAYCATKFGLVGLTETLAAELADDGILVQAVFPGPVATDLVSNTTLSRPFRGIVTPDQFADAVVRTISRSDEATVIHPHILPLPTDQ